MKITPFTTAKRIKLPDTCNAFFACDILIHAGFTAVCPTTIENKQELPWTGLGYFFLYRKGNTLYRFVEWDNSRLGIIIEELGTINEN